MAAALLLLIACSVTPDLATGRSSVGRHQSLLVHPEELRATCAGLTQTISASIERIKTLRAKARDEEKAPPSTLAEALRWGFGGKEASSKSIADMAKERARADALNAALKERGCNTVDTDRLVAPDTGPGAKSK